MLDGNALEIFGQVRCCKLPWTIQCRRFEPASSDEEIEIAVGSRPEQIGFGVLHPQERFRVVYLQIARDALQHDQLGRLGGDEDLRGRFRSQRPAWYCSLDVLPVLIRRQLGKARGQLAFEWHPRSERVAGLEP